MTGSITPDNPWEAETSYADNPHNPSNMSGNINGRLPLTPRRRSPQLTTDSTRSPFLIALHAHLLGLALGLSIPSTIYLTYVWSPLWRLPFFLGILALFHILEYYTTALFNAEGATTSAFLLNNGRAYNVAHLLAFMECLVHHYYYPSITLVPLLQNAGKYILILGFSLVLLGQIIRTTAMAQAGENFNHIVQSRRKLGHVLVTDGVYAFLRHPSYFGFFYWGIGTQMILGNVGCLLGYTVVLWQFFQKRIIVEERFLIGFFGDDYVRYRRKTRVLIPFIS